MKRKYQTLIICLMLLLILSIQGIQARTLPLFGIIITVDAGHGGRDSGTSHGKILEKDLNLQISKKLEEELTKQGAIVYMIRKSDIDLSSIYDAKKKRGDLYRRITYIEKNNSDLYLSIHINWYKNSTYSGAEVLYNQINKENKILAESIQNSFKTTLKTKREITTTDLYLYKNTKTPGALIECGYLSNINERYLLQTNKYQKLIAEAITSGVINYLKTQNKLKYRL